MSIGHVNPITGEFFIHVISGELICKKVKVGNISNIEIRTNTLEVLKNIEMIGNDLQFTCGFCDAESGKIPICGGQPTVKVKQVNLFQKE